MYTQRRVNYDTQNVEGRLSGLGHQGGAGPSSTLAQNIRNKIRENAGTGDPRDSTRVELTTVTAKTPNQSSHGPKVALFAQDTSLERRRALDRAALTINTKLTNKVKADPSIAKTPAQLRMY